MSKKDYILIATVFKKESKRIQSDDSRYTLKCLAEALSDEFEQDNDLFDSDRFLEACGIIN